MNFIARIFLAITLLLPLSALAANDTSVAVGSEKRTPFKNSRLAGSPEPPLPYRASRAFPKLNFEHPLFITSLPGTQRLIVTEQTGRVRAFTNHPDVATTENFCTVKGHEVYALAFHPDFASNRLAFLLVNGPGISNRITDKVLRYRVNPASQACDPDSRTLIIEWESNGHNGGGLAFGPDGMLYVGAGDGTSDSDRNVTGQNIADIPGGIIRIDVDRPSGGQPYSIPKDNPFLSIPGARGELWCYGMRNPWRLHFDPDGHLWVGDIGQDLWEMIIVAQRGANYGWSVTEGGHPFRLQRPRGPTPIVAPTIEHSHSEARSITGGITYRGNNLPKLRGAYVYGDYGTGRIWGARYRDGAIVWNELIADTLHQMLGFGDDARGEMFYVDYAGGIYQLEAAPTSITTNTFPQRLSDTGLFTSVAGHRLAPGIIPYSVNAPYWSDGAYMERFMALPENTRVDFQERDAWKFPEGSILIQSLALPLAGKGRTWIETRVLLLEQNEWAAYSYRWNEEQTDAVLLPASGDDREFLVARTGRSESPTNSVLNWRYPSRTECLTCHSRAAGFVLGLSSWQMNREHTYDDRRANQIVTLAHLGMLPGKMRELPAEKLAALPRLANPYNPEASLTNRIRAYLHANCSHCHTDAGGGNSAMELRATTKLNDMRILDVPPQHDTFELPDPRIIAPGHPERSTMFWRLSHRGFGQMPPLGTSSVDEDAVRLFEAWIRSLKRER